MAVNTITIDLEAYELLARHKGPGKSFSRVIKEQFEPRKTAADLRATVARARISEETVDAIEAQIRTRRASPARRVRL